MIFNMTYVVIENPGTMWHVKSFPRKEKGSNPTFLWDVIVFSVNLFLLIICFVISLFSSSRRPRLADIWHVFWFPPPECRMTRGLMFRNQESCILLYINMLYCALRKKKNKSLPDGWLAYGRPGVRCVWMLKPHTPTYQP